ncbi:hypothetical protein [Saccharothrix syringae]|uniref:Uncharacterized protein n=1 Tax=Saccharothrix syringae TaxID=103733 RepID=A0A5Q0H354_SACSY|nr:hypothetical protein [Saccharothrix syringae]QFZ20549.1 hypothetical protein EKG83_26865 [Saccharothrix syringae]
MRLKNSAGLFVDTVRCPGSRKLAIDGSIGPRSDGHPTSIYGRCPVCRQVRPVNPKGAMVGHDEPLRLVVQPHVVGGESWAAYGAPWHPAELASIPTRIGAELAWKHGDRILMTFYGGRAHRPATDPLPRSVRTWLAVHLRFVEQWTGDRDIIDLMPASQAYLLPMLSPTVA